MADTLLEYRKALRFRRSALIEAIGCLWVLMNQSAAGASMDFKTRRDDGSLIYWSLDRQHREPKQGILVVAQGSGCLAATENANLARAKSLLPDFAVITVEKYGVHPHDRPKDPFGGCSATFYAHDLTADVLSVQAPIARRARRWVCATQWCESLESATSRQPC